MSIDDLLTLLCSLGAIAWLRWISCAWLARVPTAPAHRDNLPRPCGSVVPLPEKGP
jgi:hypothetical protein